MKPLILIIENDEYIQDILKMHIESEFTTSIVFLTSTEEAINQINKKKEEISLIIAKYQLDKENSSKIYAYIRDKKFNIPFLLITDQFPSQDHNMNKFFVSNKENSYIKYPIKEHQLMESVSKALKEERPSSTENYRKIMADRVANFKSENFPIYIMDNDENYIEITSVSENKYKSKYDFFFVKNDDYKKYSEKINKQLIKRLKSPSVSTAHKIIFQFKSVENIHENLHELGLTEHEIEVGKAVTDSSIQILSKNNRISSLLGKMVKYNQYAHELAMLSSYLSVAMLMNTSWCTNHSMKKLSLAALFQDISLSSEHLAKIVSTESESFLSLSESDKKIVLEHPSTSMKHIDDVKDIQDISNNIKNIVLCHHERPKRTGFPKKLSDEQIPILSRTFIMAHEFSHRILEKKISKEILQKILVDFKEDYTSHYFKDVYDAFINVFSRRISN